MTYDQSRQICVNTITAVLNIIDKSDNIDAQQKYKLKQELLDSGDLFEDAQIFYDKLNHARDCVSHLYNLYKAAYDFKLAIDDLNDKKIKNSSVYAGNQDHQDFIEADRKLTVQREKIISLVKELQIKIDRNEVDIDSV